MSCRRQGFRLISVLTLVAQLLGLVHLVIDEHTLSASGQVVEPVALEADAHEHAGHHLCAAAPVLAAESDPACAVAASWTTSGLLGLRLEAAPAPVDALAAFAGVAWFDPDDDVLARAPKGSPPAA